MLRKFIKLLVIIGIIGSLFACRQESEAPSPAMSPTTIPGSSGVTSTPDSPAVLLTPTSESQTTPTAEALLGWPLIAVMDRERDDLGLVDLTTQTSRHLHFGKGRPGDPILGWLREGCELVIILEYQTEEEFEDAVTRIDLQGHILQNLFSTRQYQGAGKIYQMFLSPPGDQLTYLVGLGDLDYSRYAVQNLEVVSLNNSAAARRLTHGGGAWAAAWSPVKIIVVSANALKQDIAQALAAGANLYKAKPVNWNALFEELATLLTDQSPSS